MNSGMYVVQDDDQLIELIEQAYDSEDLLQGLLAKYPKLLAGDQIDQVTPRRWLLIAREVSLIGEEKGVGRVDHLFLDQDSIPTLVEVKRSSDTRIRLLKHKGQPHQLFAVYGSGSVEIYFYWYATKPPFDTEEQRRELLTRLNAIPTVSLPSAAIDRRPNIPLLALADETHLQQFFNIFDWFSQEITSS